MYCSLCHQQNENVLKIFSVLICHHCEQELLKMEATTNDYQYLIYKLTACREENHA